MFGFFNNLKLILFAVCLLAILPLAHAMPADFDSSGQSNRVVVQVQNAGDLRWRVQSDLTQTNLGLFGRVGDNLLLGNLVSSSSPSIGYIRNSSGNISWNASLSNQTYNFVLGAASDLAISGGDFDGDGIYDAVLVRQVKNRLRWTLRPNPFNSSSTTVRNHGKAGDLPFFIRLNGQRDSAAVLRRPPSGPILVIARDLTNNSITRIQRISRSLWVHGRPDPIRDSSGNDVLLFKRKTNSFTNAVVIGRDGKRILRARVEESADVVVGDFLAEPGYEFAFATSSGFNTFNPFSNVSALLEAPNGIAVDHININTFASSVDPDLPPPQDTCHEMSPNDGIKRGFVWKPASDTQFGAVVILPGKYLNKVSGVKTLKRNGDPIRTLAFKGNANPDPGNILRPHFIDRTLQGNQYRSQFRSIIVEVSLSNGACLHYPIKNPALRAD